ncbi:MAG: DUF1217 domain-containing protein [Rubellimicrobium sp.]|nr:DUF1217 domain-containing protein [Rubellimicrobium sp.]
MTFQPVVPLAGTAGWAFLNRTLDKQQAAHAGSAPMKRATDHFRANIARAGTAEALVTDRRLLEVALGAFGLEEDINARAFIRKILEEGTTRRDALSSRLADKRYAKLALAFGYGDLGARVGLPGFAEDIIARYEARRFEAAVGEQDGNLRQALNLKPALDDLLHDHSGGDARWFALMGNPPLRKLFETALGLPAAFGKLDIDRQLSTFKERSQSAFGTSDLAELAGEGKRAELTRLFLIRSESAAGGASSPGQIALSLLGNRR